MSECTATLCIWVTEFGDPCRIMESEKMYVHVTRCDGTVLEWCRRKYSFIPTECGRVEIQVPPGCYSVFATHSPQGQGIPPFGNRLTHVQVVRANCGDHICVTLFSPSLWYCGTWFAHAVNTQLEGLLKVRGLDARVARQAVTAVQNLLAKLPTDTYAENTMKAIEQEPK
jgi:hypothetical protein